MKSAQKLQDRLRRGEVTLGCMITNHLWLEFLEIAVLAGMDYVIVDMEHVTHDAALVADACRFGRMTDFPILIRPPKKDMETIRMAKDLGCCGFLLPMVESTAQLDEVRDGMYMPPRGQCRPGGHGNWWVNDYNYPTWKSEVEDQFIVLTQIESPQGIKNIDAIARHEITTALAVGPYDLSARLGVCWQPERPELQNALAAIRGAAQKAGKPMWMIGDGPTLRKQGYNFLCVAEPSFLLKAVLSQIVTQVRSSSPEASKVEAFVP